MSEEYLGPFVIIDYKDGRKDAGSLLKIERGYKESYVVLYTSREVGAKFIDVKLIKSMDFNEEEPSNEPPRPVKCYNCDATYDDCDRALAKNDAPCCGTCAYTATHNQNAWEQWKYRKKS